MGEKTRDRLLTALIVAIWASCIAALPVVAPVHASEETMAIAKANGYGR